MAYTLPDLDYDYAALEPHLSAQILEIHHGKHHAAYVAGLNTVVDELASARSSDDYSSLPGLERKHAFNLAGHVLHSLFWENLSPDGGGRPEGDLALAIDENFGGFDQFRGQMSAATVSVMGSGWGALCWEPLGQRLYVAQLYDHQGNVGPGSLPLLVLDAWEHAYYLQYQNRRPDYVDAIWNVVNWADISQRFKAAKDVGLS
jgi:superoxide dismutase, Fe-Mn family